MHGPLTPWYLPRSGQKSGFGHLIPLLTGNGSVWLWWQIAVQALPLPSCPAFPGYLNFFCGPSASAFLTYPTPQNFSPKMRSLWVSHFVSHCKPQPRACSEQFQMLIKTEVNWLCPGDTISSRLSRGVPHFCLTPGTAVSLGCHILQCPHGGRVYISSCAVDSDPAWYKTPKVSSAEEEKP